MLFSVFLCVSVLCFEPASFASSPRLLFANRKDIRILQSTNGIPNNTIVVSGLEDAISLDFDYQQKIVFWTDVSSEKIKSARLFGSKNRVRNVIDIGLNRPEGLAVDWITKKFYWTDSNRIEVADFDGSFRKVLFWRNLDQPRAIAVDPMSGYMFWTDWGEVPKIERSDMDGTNRTVIVSKSIYWPNGLTIDYKDRKIYWTDGKLNHIACTNFNGGRPWSVVRGSLPHPFALSLFGNKLYWTDWTTRSIHSCNKNTGHGIQVLMSKIDSPMDIHVFEPGRQIRLPSGRKQCGRNNGGCSHLCLLSPEGYSCACPTGVRLLLDGKSCEPGPLNFLLLARRTDIRRISLDTPDHTDVVLPLTGIKHAMAVDFDPVKKYVYWSDDQHDFIKRARIDGTGVEVVASIEVQDPDGLAVDWVAGNLYWTDTGKDRIEVCRLDGSSRTVLISEGLREPRAIVVDPGKGYMFWTDWGKNAKIERADLDGKNRLVLVNTSVIWPNGLTIDYKDQKLYWADAKLDKIEVMNFNGKNRRVIVDKNLPHVFGLTLLGDYLYWTDWLGRKVDMINKRTGRGRKNVIENLPDVMGLKAINLTISYGSNSCQKNNGGCSHLCLYTPRGHVCGCPTGMELLKDKRKCIVPEAFLLFSATKDIHRISLDTYSGDKGIPLVGVKEANALDFSIKDTRIYWSDISLKTINRAFLNGSNPENLIIVDLEVPAGLAVDWIAKNLYWTDMRTNKIEVARVDGQHRRTLIYEDIWEPRSLILDPVNGHLYWVNGGNNPSIERADMDGSNRTLIVSQVKKFPNDITLDYKEKLIFWVDSDSSVIECADFMGRNRRIIASALSRPYALTQFEEYIYWTDWDTESIERANKTTGLNRTRIRSGVDFVTDIIVFHTTRQEGWNRCFVNNGDCSHLCLARPGQQRTCSCPMHFKLLPDNKTCEAPKAFMLYSTSESVRRFIFDSNDFHGISLPLRKLHDVIAISYDVNTQYVYWIDAKTNAIRRAFENGSGDSKVLHDPNIAPYDLAIDPYGQQMYWTDTVRDDINVFSLRKMRSLGVVVMSKKGEKPRSLVLFPEKGLMFWTDLGSDGPAILRAPMDGTNPQVIVSSTLTAPEGLAVDIDSEKLYWTDTALKKIEVSDLTGANRAVLVEKNLLRPVGIAVYDQFLYWIDSQARVIKRVRKESGSEMRTIQADMDDLTDLVALDRRNKMANHPCTNNLCTHICLIGRDNTAKCSCTGAMVRKEDNRTCGEPATCPSDKFTCVDEKGNCIPFMWRCDGVDDCAEGSDEKNCPPCGPNQFRCESGQCIDGNPKCDNHKNCSDGSDEERCTTCKPNHFQCKSGKCISAEWECDGLSDCGDGSDEINCNSKNVTDQAAILKLNSQLSAKMVGGIVSSIVVCLLLFAVSLLVWRRLKRTPDSNITHDIGLVVTPAMNNRMTSSSCSSSSHASLYTKRNGVASSVASSKRLNVISNLTNSGTLHTAYDREHLTGASSTSSACTVISAYPRETLNPPPSPVTERSLFSSRSRGYCDSIMTPSTCPSHRYHRAHMPPPPTPVSTDAESSVNHPLHRHHRRSHNVRSKKCNRYADSNCTDMAYDSDLFAPPPTPNTNYLSEATHFSENECPPSPTVTERSYFHPYPPPPSPVTDTPSLV